MKRMTKVKTWLNTVTPVILTIAGFALIAVGLATIYMPLGLIAAGVSCILIERGLTDE